jgi:ferritin
VEFLSWFIKEQAEEEASAQALITKMQLFGSSCEGLYMLNAELGRRKYSDSSMKDC